MGYREAKELVCMTHGHELSGWWWGGECGRERGVGRRGLKRGKRDNCNSMINKIY